MLRHTLTRLDSAGITPLNLQGAIICASEDVRIEHLRIKFQVMVGLGLYESYTMSYIHSCTFDPLIQPPLHPATVASTTQLHGGHCVYSSNLSQRSSSTCGESARTGTHDGVNHEQGRERGVHSENVAKKQLRFFGALLPNSSSFERRRRRRKF